MYFTTMNQKEFILDIIIKKLKLKDESIKNTNNLLAKFTFGDIKLDITTGRVNVTEFGEGQSVEFRSTMDELKRKLGNTRFELTLIKQVDENEQSAVIDEKDKSNVDDNKDTNTTDDAKNRVDSREAENDDDESDSEPKEVETTHSSIDNILPPNVIGSVSIKWPPALIQRLSDNCTAVVPYIQVCEIKHEQEIVGSISLGIMLHCKCEDRQAKAKSHQPYINEYGILTAFQNARKDMEKNDVFFVIGRNPEPCLNPDSIFEESSPCIGRQRYPVHLDTSKYKLIRGSLIKDCPPLLQGACGEQDCCVPWYNQERMQKEKIEPEPKKTRRTSQEIFGSPKYYGDMRKRSSLKGDRTPDRIYSRGPEKKTSFYIERSSSTDRKSSQTKLTNQDEEPEKEELSSHGMLKQILFDPLKKYCLEQEELTREPNTRNILPPRFCSKCCENLTLYPKSAPCPKCDYKPPSKLVYSVGETVDDIVDQWDSDEKTFLENSGFSKFDHCTCHKRGDRQFRRKCLYCRVRDLCQEVPVFGPPDEEIYNPRRERILSDSDISVVKDEKEICDEILDKYGDDGTEGGSKLWQNDHNLLPHPATKMRKEATEKALERRRAKGNASSKLNKENSREERVKKMVKTMYQKEPEQPKPKPPTLKQLIKEMKRKYSHRYCFPKRKYIDKMLVTHDECVPERHRVPANMGWLWCNNEQAMRRGWRPGKIGRTIRDLMQYFLRDFPVDSLPTTQEIAQLIKPALKPEPEEELVQKPTLHITKQDGQFLVTMHPLKNKKELHYSADPYAKTDPIQFKIAKDPLDMKRRQVKRYLKDIGFRKCICKLPLAQCNCRSYMEKHRLDNSLKHICDLVQATSLRDAVCLSDTTDSESHLNIEFTPPAGVIKPHLATKPDVAEICTQYEENDYSLQFPKRTEKIIKEEIKMNKKHYCGGAIENAPLQPTPAVRKGKKAKHKAEPKSKDASNKGKKDVNKYKDIAKEASMVKSPKRAK